jgi:hypothetical protein
MREVQRVANKAPFGVPAINLQLAHQQRGRTRGDHDFRIEGGIERG